LGDWVTERMIVDGKHWSGGDAQGAPRGAPRWIFRRDVVLLQTFNPLVQVTFFKMFRYEISEDRSPKCLDLWEPDGRIDRGEWKGIYRFAGDTLTVCYRSFPGDVPRPTTFESQPGSRANLLTLRLAATREVSETSQVRIHKHCSTRRVFN
jgi:uncharacterized protein (TIGR03067 family)